MSPSPAEPAPRPTPRAVVFDTNVWSSGRFHAETFKVRADRLGKAGFEVWVPEVVLWEWASHSAQDARSGADTWRRLTKAGLVKGPYPGPADHDDALKRLTDLVTAIANVRVLSVSGAAAIAGLRDQVFQTGPGSTKQNVKTGAADSTWVRDVLAAAGNDAAVVLFVSGDIKGITSTCRALGIEDPQIVQEHQLFSTLLAFDPAPAAATRLVANHLLVTFDTALQADDYHSPPAEPWIDVTEFDIHDNPIGLEDLFAGQLVTLDPEPTLIGVRQVEVLDYDESKPEQATVKFDVVLLGQLTVWQYDMDADGAVETTTATLWNQLIEAPMIAAVHDLSLSDVVSDGPARVSDPGRRFDDGMDALQWMVDALLSFEGLTVHLVDEDGEIGAPLDDPWQTFTGEDELLLRSPSGRTVAVNSAGTSYDDWTVEFELPGGSVEIECAYDPSVRVWAGRDSFDRRPPCQLTSSGRTPAADPFAALGAVWRFLYASPD